MSNATVKDRIDGALFVAVQVKTIMEGRFAYGAAHSDWKQDLHFEKILSCPPRMVGMVVEWQGEPVGLAWAQADSYMLTEEPLCVTVHLIAVDLTQKPLRRAKAFLSLLSGLKQWAASLNAGPLFIHVTTGSNLKSTDRLLKAAGAQCVGGAYVA